MMLGKLYIVATPIGHLADITLRALEVLRSVGLIAAEDTRRTRKLLTHYEIRKPLTSYHSHNMDRRGPELVRKMQAGSEVALVTDAGTPGISDPGAALVQECLKAGVPVEVIPGPTALISALVASGLPTHPFAFLGFPPRRTSLRKEFFAAHAALPLTVILYESPKRLPQLLRDLLEHWGDRRAAVGRELTKKHEEIFRGTLAEALEHFAEGARGEVTLVVEGAPRQQNEEKQTRNWRNELHRRITKLEQSTKDATREIVKEYKVSRQEVYQEAVRIREGKKVRR